ncbi:MAG: phosphoribosylformylglycinamidine synthase subunit PurL [Thermoguttaceae bacterium]|nr:phosphoribosylformylglycinamidine synthase subunit PurL [Thermoguttaceae bacterium]
MLWEVDIFAAPGQLDRAASDTVSDAADMGLSSDLTAVAARGYLIEGDLDAPQVEKLAALFLADPVVERTVIGRVGDPRLDLPPGQTTAPEPIYVLPKPGVTDSVADNARKTFPLFGVVAEGCRTFKKYWISGVTDAQRDLVAHKLLANDAIEQLVRGKLPFTRLQVGSPGTFNLRTVAIRAMSEAELETLSKEGQLFLSVTEMKTIQNYFNELGRDPTDIELETIAQTWSEHCSHKTLAGRITYSGPEGEKTFNNMLKETIFAATVEIRKNLGPSDFCVSVFSDNAGVVTFNDEYNVCFKVETHNHPSALEPYGGANTGLGGVIRDPMGTGMGAKPVCNTDVFCFAPPETDVDALPPGVLHPRRIIKGVVAGVRDYGNRMGIPTVNGAVYFDKRYLGNPLVYCGNIGLIPVNMSFKHPQAGDLIVAIGGRTGRDGIHGATFSSAELTSESETLSGGAVQIGNAITEKMVLDVMLEARDRGLYNAVTDCGAGGFSSAVGEMGEEIGAEVELDAAPLKYDGLSYTEIWISEAQERMVFSVPKEKWNEFRELAESENVEAVVLGEFKPTGRLVLNYKGIKVADLPMSFLHDGRPPVIRRAVYAPTPVVPLHVRMADDPSPAQTTLSAGIGTDDWNADLDAVLASLNVASKHWVVRQYDHEVQGGSVIKPLVGVCNDGPGDAAVLRPLVSSRRALVVSCGMNPNYGDFDTADMAASAIDEAVRNAVAVGADPATIVLLDNFCWGNTDRPETLGSLVRSALACYDVAVGFGTPFVSGKDSLNNEFRDSRTDELISIPPSLLISAMGQMPDAASAVSMDLKEAGDSLYLVGETKNELGGSHFALVRALRGGKSPSVDIPRARRTFYALHQAIQEGLVRAAHDLSEGGLAVAAAEMAFAGNLGAELWTEHLPVDFIPGDREKLAVVPGVTAENAADLVRLFSESNSRFLVEVPAESASAFEAIFARADLPLCQLGKVTASDRLVITGVDGKKLIDRPLRQLKAVWQKAFDLGGDYQ